MKALVILVCWTLIAWSVYWTIYDYEFGIMTNGPLAALGVGLLGAAVVFDQHRKEEQFTPHEQG